MGQKRDYSAGIVGGFPVDEPTDGTIWQTCILGMYKIRSQVSEMGAAEVDLLDIVELMCRNLFDHFPMAEATVCDATRDTGVANWLGRRYGRQQVEGFIFGDKSHMEAWHSTLYYVNDPRGYPWPQLSPGSRIFTWVAELQDQMITEEVRINDLGRFSFRHPGPHNDWLHSFEMLHYKARQLQSMDHNDGLMAAAAGRPAFTQDTMLRPPFLAALDQRAGRNW